VERVSIESLKDAVVKVADIVFVLSGAAFGTVLDKAKGRDHDKARWTPTKAERKLVLGPTSNIVGRHVTGDTAMADTLDVVLIGAGLGAFGTRAIYDIEVLDEDEPTGAPNGA
jgi:hypothetical protein